MPGKETKNWLVQTFQTFCKLVHNFCNKICTTFSIAFIDSTVVFDILQYLTHKKSKCLKTAKLSTQNFVWVPRKGSWSMVMDDLISFNFENQRNFFFKAALIIIFVSVLQCQK